MLKMPFKCMHIPSVSGFTFSPYQNPCTLKRDRYTSSHTHIRHYARISIKPLQSETIQMQMLQFTKLLLKQQINYVVFFHICAPELAECMCVCMLFAGFSSFQMVYRFHFSPFCLLVFCIQEMLLHHCAL